MCNDYKVRGAFLFDNESIFYNCFNCGFTSGFDPSQYKTPSKKFRELLLAFGVPEEEISKAVGKTFIEHQGSVPSDKPKTVTWAPPKSIELPDKLHHILDDTSPWCSIARDYVKDRGLDPACYPFMVSEAPKLLGRLIIPYFHRDRLTYYQGRSLDDVTIQPRYANPVVEKERLIFNYDELLDGQGPLYVTEGAFDALSIGPACALSDSNLGDWKLAELRKAAARGRRIIFVIDKNSNGFNLGLAALKEGWFVTVMPDGIDDANSCHKKFGHLWLLNHLATTHVTGVAGEVLLRMKCDRTTQHRKHRA
jgi:hypothetical protein